MKSILRLRHEHHLDGIRALLDHLDALQELLEGKSVRDDHVQRQLVFGYHINGFRPAMRSQVASENTHFFHIA